MSQGQTERASIWIYGLNIQRTSSCDRANRLTYIYMCVCVICVCVYTLVDGRMCVHFLFIYIYLIYLCILFYIYSALFSNGDMATNYIGNIF